MKTLAQSALLAACLTTALSVQAQTLLSDFSSSAGFGSSTAVVGTAGALSIQNGVANYYTPGTPGESDFAYITYTGAVGSYTSNWTMKVDIFYATPGSLFDGTDSNKQQAINVGLLVTKSGDSIGVNGLGVPAFNAFSVSSNLYSDGSGGYSRDLRPSVFVANTEPVDNETRYLSGTVSGASSATIYVNFNATTKVLMGGYDANGATGGYTPTWMTTAAGDRVDTDGSNSWSMGAGDTFAISLFGNSLFDGDTEVQSGIGPTLAIGDVTFDTFTHTGLTAIPEPSTYAAMAGVLALGLAAWRRRQRATAV